MIRRLDLPDGPGTADREGRIHAASAARNLGPLLDVLLPRLPRRGRVLELASGSGQHIAALAAHRPDLSFVPTEPDPDRRIAIDARCRGLPNVAQAADLDACRSGWGAIARPVEAVIVSNLLHLISDAEMAVLLDEALRALASGGLFACYGPFLRDGAATSDGDRAFDACLRAQDPEIGLKDAETIETVLAVTGLRADRVEMPANNLTILGRMPG